VGGLKGKGVSIVQALFPRRAGKGIKAGEKRKRRRCRRRGERRFKRAKECKPEALSRLRRIESYPPCEEKRKLESPRQAKGFPRGQKRK